MPNDIPSELKPHYTRISPELRDFFAQVVGPRFLPTNVKELVQLLWNLVDDPIYEQDEELRYLSSKIGVMLGHYDLSIKCIRDGISGTKVWGGVALFHVGQIDEAFSNLQQIIENESVDVLPLVEALIWIIYLKIQVGETENLDKYKSQLEKIFESNKFKLIPRQIKALKIFADALLSLHAFNDSKGLQKLREFIDLRKDESDQFWQLMGLLVLGDYVLDSSNYELAETVYMDALKLAKNLDNTALIGACQIGIGSAYYIRGNLKEGNLLIAQTIEDIKGKSIYYLANAYYVRGQIFTKMGQHKNAINFFNKAKTLFVQYKDYHKIFKSLISIVDCYLYLNEPDKASKVYEEAYTQILNISNKKHFVKALVEIVNGLYRQGRFDEAIKRINQIETLSEEIVYQKGKTDALKLRAKVNIATNKNLQEQIFLLQACQILYAEVGDEENIAECSLLLGEVYTLLQELDKSFQHIEEAKDYYLKVNDTMKIAEIKELQANFDITNGRFDEALVKLRSSYSHYSAIFDTTRRARCLRKIGDLLAFKGNLNDGLDRYKKVVTMTGDSLNQIENVILTINKARIYVALHNYEKAIENYKNAENFFVEHEVQEGIEIVQIERAYTYALMKDYDTLNDLIEVMTAEADNYSQNFRCWLKFIQSISVKTDDPSELYSVFADCFSQTVNTNSYVAISTILFIVEALVKLYIQDTTNQFIETEISNYISLGFSLCSEKSFYYLKGLFYLLNIAWKEISKQPDVFIVISEAAEYFTMSGFDKLGNLILNIQYNINRWHSINNGSNMDVLTEPVKYESPLILLEEILNDAKHRLFMERILQNEIMILKSYYS